MRLVRIEIRRYRRIVDQRLGWYPITVLFGPNDSGKTSLLDAIDATFRALAGDRDAKVSAGVVVELDHLADPDGVDRLVWEQIGNEGVVWLHPDWFFADAVRDGDAAPDELSADAADETGLRSWNEVPDDPSGVIAEYAQEVVGVTEDPAVAAAAVTCLEWMLRRKVFRFSAGDSFEWIPHPIPPDEATASAAALLSEALPVIKRRVRETEKHSFERRLAEARAQGLTVSEAMSGQTFDLGSRPPSSDVLATMQAAVAAFGASASDDPVMFRSFEYPVVALWRVVRVSDPDAGRSQAEQRLAEVIQGVVRRRQDVPDGVDPWLEEGEDGWFRVHPIVSLLCDEATRRANAIAPDFITRDYQIEVAPTAPSRWNADNGAARISITLSLRSGDESHALRLTEVGAGIGVWTSYVILEAVRRLLDEAKARAREAGPDPTPEEVFHERIGYAYKEGAVTPEEADFYSRLVRYPLIPAREQHTVYLFDEPERHLHPHAQTQARDRIAGLVNDEDCSVVVATHSLEFLDLPSENVEYVRVSTDQHRLTRLSPMTADVVGTLAREADLLGLRPTQFVHLLRGVLLVEGFQDRLVVEHFFGNDLARVRIRILPLHGARNVLSLAEAGHLASLRIPMFVMLDNVRPSALRLSFRGRRRKSEEALLTLTGGDPEGTAYKLIPFDLPDVIYALPDDATELALKRTDRAAAHRFPGWAELEQRYRAVRRGTTAHALPDPKEHALRKELGISLPPTAFIRRVLRHCSDDAKPAPPLARAVHKVLAEAANQLD